MYCLSRFFSFFLTLHKLYYHNAVLILWVDEDDFSAAYAAFLIVLHGSIMIISI